MRGSAAWGAVRLAMVAALAGCSSLPTSGPSNGEIQEQFASPEANPTGAYLVELTPAVTEQLRAVPGRALGAIDRLRSNRAIDLLGPGDILSVTIYEAGSGLFNGRRSGGESGLGADTAPPPTGSTGETLPRLQVDRNGTISIPYAGTIKVAGSTTTQVQRMIENRLAQQASQAQVLVTLASNGSNVVYVSGDVKNSGRFPLSLSRERLLDVIALAGGPTHSPQDTVVKITRRGQSASTSLTAVQTNADENIAVEPLDRIQADYLPRSFLSFGATGKVAQLPFDSAQVSLAEAVARVGGLNDDRANPEGVYLFRFEDAADTRALGLPVRSGTLASPNTPGALPAGTPIVYRVNMRNPQSYFTLQRFTMRDKDLIYIANAPTVQIYKFLQLIYTFTTPATTGAILAK